MKKSYPCKIKRLYGCSLFLALVVGTACRTAENREVENTVAANPAPYGSPVAPDTSQANIDFQKLLAQSRARLLETRQREGRMEVYCNFAPDARGCQLVLYSEELLELQRKSALRSMLSAIETESIRNLATDLIDPSETVEIKAQLDCKEITEELPPYSPFAKAVCQPVDLLPVSRFPLQFEMQQHLVTLLGLEGDSRVEAELSTVGSLECKAIIGQAYSLCSLINRSSNDSTVVDHRRSQTYFETLKMNWLSLQRLEGMVGPISIPSSMVASVSCQKENSVRKCFVDMR